MEAQIISKYGYTQYSYIDAIKNLLLLVIKEIEINE